VDVCELENPSDWSTILRGRGRGRERERKGEGEGEKGKGRENECYAEIEYITNVFKLHK
jgi:hypothetical protein